jgi:hypothetical protein
VLDGNVAPACTVTNAFSVPASPRNADHVCLSRRVRNGTESLDRLSGVSDKLIETALLMMDGSIARMATSDIALKLLHLHGGAKMTCSSSDRCPSEILAS